MHTHLINHKIVRKKLYKIIGYQYIISYNYIEVFSKSINQFFTELKIKEPVVPLRKLSRQQNTEITTYNNKIGFKFIISAIWKKKPTNELKQP